MRSWSVVELEDKDMAAQTMPITRDKQRHLESEIGAVVEVEIKGLVSGKAGKGNNNNNEDNNREAGRRLPWPRGRQLLEQLQGVWRMRRQQSLGWRWAQVAADKL